MKFTVNTVQLQLALSKVQKGAGNGKIIPITSCFNFEVNGGTLTITATNLNHFIIYKLKLDTESEDGSAIINGETIVKLVSKTTKDKISFTTDDNSIHIKGNGNYSIPLMTEKFPTFEFEEKIKKEVNTLNLQNAFKINKSAIAIDMTTPCLTGYFINDKCITTDGVKMCLNDYKVFDNNSLLIPQSLAELVGALDDEMVDISSNPDDGKLLFNTSNMIIFGNELDGKDTYPDISHLLTIEFPEVCQIDKTVLLNALDRLAIFTNELNGYAINILFKEDRLEISTNKSNIEIVPYASNKANEDNGFTISVSITPLMNLVGSLPSNVFNLYYGQDTLIKLGDDKVSEILALLSEEE